MIPVPDFSDDSDDLSDSCNTNIVAPPNIVHNFGQCSNTLSAKIPKVHESANRFELFSLAQSCDPDSTFSFVTPTGIEYDKDHPIYKTKSCTLYIGRRSNLYYALKTSQASNILMHEWENYNKIGKFPTIINAVDFIEEKAPKTSKQQSKHYLQLEYAFGGAITNIIQFIDFREAWKILAHIAAALNHIHKKGFIHLDISPSNILQCNSFSSNTYTQNTEDNFDSDDEDPTNTDYIYKLADFGTVLKEGCFDTFCEGAGPYVSPEALQWPHSDYPVSYPTDIWSLGAVMFEIVTHKKMPRDAERYDAIRRGQIDLSALIPEEFEIVRQMLRVDPSLRPTAEQLIQLPKVKDILQSLEENLSLNPITEEIHDVLKDNYQKNSLSKLKWNGPFQKILSNDNLPSFSRTPFDVI